jgi:hypothetical protein
VTGVPVVPVEAPGHVGHVVVGGPHAVAVDSPVDVASVERWTGP